MRNSSDSLPNKTKIPLFQVLGDSFWADSTLPPLKQSFLPEEPGRGFPEATGPATEARAARGRGLGRGRGVQDLAAQPGARRVFPGTATDRPAYPARSDRAQPRAAAAGGTVAAPASERDAGLPAAARARTAQWKTCPRAWASSRRSRRCCSHPPSGAWSSLRPCCSSSSA